MDIMSNEFVTFGLSYDASKLTERHPMSDYIENSLHKPNGLWACVRTYDGEDEYNSQWSDWCKSEMFSTEKLKFGFSFKLKPTAKILVIEHLDDIKPFVTEGLDLVDDVMSCLYGRQIKVDFERIYKEYDGMFVAYFENYGEFHTSMFNSYDVDSLIVWNSDVVENVNQFKQTIQ